MSEPSAFSLSQLFTDLLDRPVKFSEAPRQPPSPAQKIFGVYEVEPGKKPVVVRADLNVLATISGILAGLPPALAVERAGQSPMEEVIRDAIHEVLNICSSSISCEERVLFRSMATLPAQLPSPAAQLLSKAPIVNEFKVSVSGKECGMFTILEAL